MSRCLAVLLVSFLHISLDAKYIQAVARSLLQGLLDQIIFSGLKRSQKCTLRSDEPARAFLIGGRYIEVLWYDVYL